MERNIHTLLVTSLIAGTFCQKIVLDATTFTTPCNTSARSGVDRYLIAGTIGENITEALNQNWQPIVLLQALKKSSSNFIPLCQFVIRGAKCGPSPAARCGCLYNTTTDRAHFTANYTTQADDSNAVIRAQWQNTNGTYIYSNKNTLQEIYDADAGQLTLTVTDAKGNLPSGVCSFSLTLNKSNNLTLCCSNTATPCYPRIYFNETVVTKNTSMCVTYQASQLASDGVTVNLNLSYSVCTQTDYILGNNCYVTRKPDVTTETTASSSSSPDVTDGSTTNTESSSSSLHTTDGSALTTESSSSSSHTTDASTTTTELSSSSSHTTAPPKPDPVCNTTCIAVIVSVVVVIIIIGVAVAIYCWKTKKRPKGVSNQGTNGNGDQAHTGVHHKKDGHHTEHRNQAYDGRRSSPSEVTIHGVKTTTNDNVQQHNKAHEKNSNKPTSGRTDDDNASQSVPGNPRQLPPLKGTHTHGQLHPPAVSRPASVEITSTHQL